MASGFDPKHLIKCFLDNLQRQNQSNYTPPITESKKQAFVHDLDARRFPMFWRKPGGLACIGEWKTAPKTSGVLSNWKSNIQNFPNVLEIIVQL